jgi:hypothetical protein
LVRSIFTAWGGVPLMDAMVLGPNLSQPRATLYELPVMKVRIAVESLTHVRFHPVVSRW